MRELFGPAMFAAKHQTYGFGLVACPCDDIIEKHGFSGFFAVVEDMPNWTAWFGSFVFVRFLHRAIRLSGIEAGVKHD